MVALINHLLTYLLTETGDSLFWCYSQCGVVSGEGVDEMTTGDVSVVGPLVPFITSAPVVTLPASRRTLDVCEIIS